MAGQDINLLALRAAGLDGSGQNVTSVDYHVDWPLLRTVYGGHDRLQGSIIGAQAAPGASVQRLGVLPPGAFLVEAFRQLVAPNSQSPIPGRIQNTAQRAVASAAPGGTMNWVAPINALDNQQAIDLLGTLQGYTDAGGTVVIGTGVFSPQQLADPNVQQAIRDANLVVVDPPLQAGNVPSGQSAPSGAGDLVTVALPTVHGHGSVATPLVASVVALLKQEDPTLTNDEILAILGDTDNFQDTVETRDGTAVPFFNAEDALSAVRSNK